jgi:hypothetical protein
MRRKACNIRAFKTMDEIPGGFWRAVAEGFIQGQLKKPLFGRPHLKFGQGFGLWGYMVELGGILGAKHAANIDAFVSAFLGMGPGEPGVVNRVLVAQANSIVERHSLASMNFWDYVGADIADRTSYKGGGWHNLVSELGANKLEPKLALTNSWEYASVGAALGTTHPDVLRAMFERTHAPVSKETWRRWYVAGLDIGPEQPQTSYAEAEATENKNFMEFCQQFRPDLYADLKD